MSDQLVNKLVWIDLEMTGLSVKQDKILEIACIITDQNLAIIDQSPNLVIAQPESVLEQMDAWNMVHHTQSGLLEEARRSTLSVEQAEQTVLTLVKNHCKPQQAALCGNSVWVDRMFLQTFMPTLEKYLYYRTIDVSSIKLLAQNWFNIDTTVMLNKQNKHRVLDDIKESIAELNWYRKTIFKQVNKPHGIDRRNKINN